MNKAEETYERIRKRTDDGEWLQRLADMPCSPVPLIRDVGEMLKNYGPMLADIRQLYGCRPFSYEDVSSVMYVLQREILADLKQKVDPMDDRLFVWLLPRMYLNFDCVRAIAWRLGLMTAILSATGEELSSDPVVRILGLLRTMFPIATVKTPDKDAAVTLLSEAENTAQAGSAAGLPG